MADTDEKVSFTIADAARMIGMSASALRAWEREGLVTPLRSETGYRRYSTDDLAVLRRIRHLRQCDQIGVVAIRSILGIQETPDRLPRQSGARPQQHWRTRLKQLRQKCHLSLRQASSAAGLSPSFISAIERGLANPSIAALQKLTAAYGTNIVELMDVPAQEARSLVRPPERRRYDLVEGVRMEQLNFGNHRMELHLFTVEPGADTGGSYQHEGEEFIFMLEGELEVWLDEIERCLLESGDVLYFESTRLHRWTNPGQGRARFLGANTPPTF